MTINKEAQIMKRLLSMATLVVALACVVAAPASARDDHVSGVQSPPLTPGPGNPCAATASSAYTMAGSMVGCWYTDTFVVIKDKTSHGIQEIHAIGTEHFEGCLDLNGDGKCAGGDPRGTLAFTYTFTGLFDATTGKEIRGHCHHPIVSGTGAFADATGALNFVDNVANGTAAYTGHINL